MKKENEFFGQKMTKEEMKKIIGGQEQDNDNHTCSYWPSMGYPMVLASCTGSLDGCTQACNSWCDQEPGCVDNTCNCF
ncbi:MAG: hypothetical protein J0H55_10580 [Chitinophagaceae bacterium]|nr:hypothetical protein [Chitinophagaceae bacterium]